MGIRSTTTPLAAFLAVLLVGALIAATAVASMAVPTGTSPQVDGSSHTITISTASDREPVDYRFRAAVGLETTESVNLGDSDSKEGLTASGTVGLGGEDTYRFRGPITLFESSNLDGLTVTVDGEEVNPAAFGLPSGPVAGQNGEPPHTITVLSAPGLSAEYGLETARALTASENINPEEGDSLSGTSATGEVAGGGVDTYYFNGQVTQFLIGDPDAVTVYLDGQPIDPEVLGANRLLVTKNRPAVEDGPVSYRVSVSGEIAAGTTADASQIDGQIATGTLGPERGVDDYYFTGTGEIEVSGDARVYLNGEPVEQSTGTGIPIPTATPIQTPTATTAATTPTPTATRTETAMDTDTDTPNPTVTATSTSVPTLTPIAALTETPVPTATATATELPSATATPARSPSIPAAPFVIDRLAPPTQTVDVGEPARFEFTVSNIASRPATTRLTVSTDNRTLGQQNLSIAANSSRGVTFSESFETVGERNITLNIGNDTATVRVRVGSKTVGTETRGTQDPNRSTAKKSARTRTPLETTTAFGSDTSGFLGGISDAVLFVLLAVAIVAVLVGVALFSGRLDRDKAVSEDGP